MLFQVLLARRGRVFVQIGVASADLKSANAHIARNTPCTPCDPGFSYASMGDGASVSTSVGVVGTLFLAPHGFRPFGNQPS